MSLSSLQTPVVDVEVSQTDTPSNIPQVNPTVDLESGRPTGEKDPSKASIDNEDMIVRPDAIIAICGLMGAGKDTLADILTSKMAEHEQRFQRMAFADPIKDLISAQFNISRSDIEEWKRKAAPPPGFSRPIRELLQHMGDMRTFDPMLWVNKLLEAMPSTGVAIITDVRYENELEALRKRGAITVLVTSTQWPRYDNTDAKHSSEQGFKALHERIAVLASQSKPNGEQAEYRSFPELGIDYYVCNDGKVSKLEAVAQAILSSDKLAHG